MPPAGRSWRGSRSCARPARRDACWRRSPSSPASSRPRHSASWCRSRAGSWCGRAPGPCRRACADSASCRSRSASRGRSAATGTVTVARPCGSMRRRAGGGRRAEQAGERLEIALPSTSRRRLIATLSSSITRRSRPAFFGSRRRTLRQSGHGRCHRVEEACAGDRDTLLVASRGGKASGKPVDARCDCLQPLRPVPDRVGGGHVRQQRLRRADVRRRLVAADVLFAGLQRQPVAGPALASRDCPTRRPGISRVSRSLTASRRRAGHRGPSARRSAASGRRRSRRPVVPAPARSVSASGSATSDDQRVDGLGAGDQRRMVTDRDRTCRARAGSPPPSWRRPRPRRP